MGALAKFLLALGNLVKTGSIKNIDEAMKFAKQEFGEVSELLEAQIKKVFKTKGKAPGIKQQETKGDVVPFKQKEGIETLSKDENLSDVLRRFEESSDIAYRDLINETLVKLQKSKGEERKQIISDIIGRKDLFKYLEPEDARMLLRSVDVDETASKKVFLAPFHDYMKKESFRVPGGSMYAEGNLRTAMREFLRTEAKEGRLKLNEKDMFRVEEYSPVREDDPIDVFRRYYGEDALEAADAMADKLKMGESFKDYERIFRENMPELKPKVKGAGEYDPNVQEAENIRKLDDFDPKDRKPNAEGGLNYLMGL